MYTLYIKLESQNKLLRKIYEERIKVYSENLDSGFDLIIPGDGINLTSNKQTVTIDHKIQCMVLKNNSIPVGYTLYPRSSISKTNYIMHNSVGIIDAGYRGNIIGKLVKIYDVPVIHNQYNQILWKRLFQICSPDYSKLTVKIVDTLPETNRGTGGFGSTGK